MLENFDNKMDRFIEWLYKYLGLGLKPSPVRWGFLSLLVSFFLFVIGIFISMLTVYLQTYGGNLMMTPSWIIVWGIVSSVLAVILFILAIGFGLYFMRRQYPDPISRDIADIKGTLQSDLTLIGKELGNMNRTLRKINKKLK